MAAELRVRQVNRIMAARIGVGDNKAQPRHVALNSAKLFAPTACPPLGCVSKHQPNGDSIPQLIAVGLRFTASSV